MTANPIEQFRDTIIAAGLTPPDVIEPDKLHRFPGIGKRNGNTAGWCKLFADGMGGSFGDWSTGLHENWQAKRDKPMSDNERQVWRRQIDEARKQAEAEREAQHMEAAQQAKLIFGDGKRDESADHPYAMKKRVNLFSLVRRGAWPQRGWTDALLVPLFDAAGKLATLEAINADGEKDYLKGGRKRGCFYPFGKLRGATVVMIGEGVASTAAGVDATDWPAAAAMDAGNLLATAQAVRELAPEAVILFLADNDVRDVGRNPGVETARDAAEAVGGFVAIPELDGRTCDWWDVWNERGAGIVGDLLAAAIRPQSAPAATDDANHQSGDDDAPVGEYARDVSLIRASDVIPEPISWLWNGWLAAGKMHVFGGAPGTGKTTISMGLAATVTTGGRWPDGTRSIAGNVVIWSGEDDPADTLFPRLALSGADLSRVYFIADIREGNERRSFDPARDMEPLRRRLAEIGGVKLLIVDPVVSAIAGDSHKNAEVRRGLQPLVDLAGAMRCALLGITHFSKGTGGRDPVERLTGSLAFGALARVVLVAAKHQEEGEDGRTVRLFCRAKSNIGPDDGGFEYDLHQAELKTHPGIFASSVLWGEAVEGAARELLATADATGDDGEGGTLADAKRFLADLLADGPMRAGEIFKDADQAGYSKRSIQRAANAIKIERHKDGMRGGWTWRLPPKMPNRPEDAVDAEQKALAPLAPSAASSVVEVEI